MFFILHFYKNKSSTGKGYTLVELLVSLFILSTVASLVLWVIWISLKTTVKVNNMHVVRQNGYFIALQLSKMLEFSQQFQGVSLDNTSYTTNCQKPDTLPLQNYKYVRLTSQDNGTVTFACLDSSSTIASNGAALINTAQYTVSNCTFTCTQYATGFPYTIGINFTLAKISSGNIIDDATPVVINTSATIRNVDQ